MSTNAMLALLYVELGVFVFAIAGPIVMKLIDDARVAHEPSASGEQRDLVVSRLTT